MGNSAVDHKRYEAIKRLRDVIDKIERGHIIVESLSYLQTMDHKDGMLIITSPNQDAFRFNGGSDER